MTSNIGSLHLLEGSTTMRDPRDARDRVLASCGCTSVPSSSTASTRRPLQALTLQEIEQIVDLQIDGLTARLADGG
jgi:hypothetical protein